MTAIKSCWALLIGIALIMLGNGLQGTLLGLRATMEGFSTGTIGAVMTGYFAGFLVGSFLVPKFLKNVGHIRVFAALASLASVSVLIHPLYPEPVPWFVLRLITGFAYAGLYVVAESWLNDIATNETRGQLLGIYMVIMLGGMGAGQFMLNLSSPGGAELFILVSVLVSFSVVPISLSVTRGPRFDTPEHISMVALYRASPLGLVGTLVTGMSYGAMFSMSAVFGAESGFSVAWVSYFVASILFGGVLMQWPVGRISDHMDRRRVIITVALVAATASVSGFFIVERSPVGFLFLMALFGGTSLPLYSLFIAHTNDFLRPEQMVAASATLVLVGGIGAMMGPTLCAIAMSLAGPGGFLWYLAAVHTLVAGFAVYRMTQRPPLPLDEQGHYASVAPRATGLAAGIASRTVREQRDKDMARLMRY
ncbi:MAG: MFS transporter [Gammaproteobacteria bacterium]|nr:MFS transporter [Gammaproteobacteria bacterium]